ncbi:MAG: peptidase C39 family protein [Nanoarchaeota archaeon]|nr:peptidase C39 family protein [Nanoarchaeota archaeon]
MIPYLQTTPFTTAASSLLSIIHHYNAAVPLSREKEFKIWTETITPPTRASSIYALALCAKKYGLTVKIIVGKKEYDFPDYRFYRYTKTDMDHAAFAEQLHLQRAEQENIPIKVGTLAFQDLERELDQQNIVLLRVNVKPLRQEQRNSSNFIVVYGSTQEHFQIIDPATGASCVPRKLLEEAFSSLGDKKYRDKRMIVFSGQVERRTL